MSSNILTEAQLVRAMGFYIIDHHTALWRLYKQVDDNNDERSKRLSELSFEILSELAFARYDKELNNLFGDEEE